MAPLYIALLVALAAVLVVGFFSMTASSSSSPSGNGSGNGGCKSCPHAQG